MTRELLLQYICPTTCTKDCSFLGRNGDVICDYCYVKLNEWLDEYDKHVLEQYKADTNLKDTIREIHDNVAQEMYCKGIDDFVNKINESNQGHWRPTRYEHGEVVSETMSYDIGTIRLIAKQLKEGGKNEN